MPNNTDLRVGRQLLSLIIDYFVGVLSYLLFFIFIEGMEVLGFEVTQDFLILYLGIAAYLLPSLFLNGATLGVYLVGGHVVRNDEKLSTAIILVRGILYFPIMVLGLYVLILKGLFATAWPYDPIFGVRIVKR